MREMHGGGKPRLISLLTIYLLPRVTLGCEMIQLFIAAHSLFINRFYKLLFLAREILPIDLDVTTSRSCLSDTIDKVID